MGCPFHGDRSGEERGTGDRSEDASPTEVSHRAGTVICEFTGMGVSEGDLCKLFGKEQGSRRPVVGTVTL